VRKRGLEPLWVTPPDPKSGASANFATSALSPVYNGIVLKELVESQYAKQKGIPERMPFLLSL
jgi:hypothetical protein